MAADVLLSLEDVTIRYGATIAVDALCLEVHRGEVFGLLGPNGSGKSSTISAIAALIRPCAGAIRLAGVGPDEGGLGYRRLFGIVPQELAIFEELSGEDNLLFFGRLYGLRSPDLRRRVREALDFVQLAGVARRPAHTYSGGMQRRLNLACALLHRPALLLLDEPTVGLDIQSREAIFASLRRLRAEGVAVIFTTHHLEEAEQLCDRIAIMQRGALCALGTLEELAQLVPESDDEMPELPHLEAVGGHTLRHGPHALAPGPWPAGPAGMGPPRATLTRVYLQLTGRSPRP